MGEHFHETSTPYRNYEFLPYRDSRNNSAMNKRAGMVPVPAC